MVNSFKTQLLVLAILSLAWVQASADESESQKIKKTSSSSFWLTNIVSLEKTKSQEPPALSTQGGYEMIGNITLEGNKLTLVDSDTCSVTIEKTEPFVVDRALSSLIKYAGGDSKFRNILKSKLNTNLNDWSVEYLIQESSSGECPLLQYGMLYGNEKELILYASPYFYKFQLRTEKKVLDKEKLQGYSEIDCKPITPQYKKNIDYCIYADRFDAASNETFKYQCYLTKDSNSKLIYATQSDCVAHRGLDLHGGP